MAKLRRMHAIFIKQYLKQIMEYKVDFVVGVLGVFLTQGLNLLFLSVLFQHIPSLEGWTFEQIAFIYGFSLIPKGIDHLFFDNLWALGQRLVRKGEFDKYLTRPISPLFHVLVETFQVDALGELLVGVILLVTTAGSIVWTLPKVLLFILVIPFAFTAYYPASYFLTGQHLLFNIGGLVVVSLLVLALSLKLWKWGLGAYESAGS
ncbi:ABC transporter permease [Streptococcus pyogenes]|uniref:ABC transporter permease n=1 Tax=Streptococcus pyogenes TaxID=1314 RepID=UPI0010A0F83E|nr:ABC-2 family transporter protein [Streptococcus pyogenes]VHG30031.1 ABC transporter permease [Streptococcus pyogenes]